MPVELDLGDANSGGETVLGQGGLMRRPQPLPEVPRSQQLRRNDADLGLRPSSGYNAARFCAPARKEESVMRRLFTITLFVVLAACQASAEDQGDSSLTPSAEYCPERINTTYLEPGVICKLGMESSPPSDPCSGQQFSGTVSEVTKNEIVLINAAKERWVERRTPILWQIPYVGWFFKNVRIEREEVGTVRVSIAEVSMIEVYGVDDFQHGSNAIVRMGVDFR
jgi:hypothetical protein